MYAYKKETQSIQIMIISFFTGCLYLVLAAINHFHAPAHLVDMLQLPHLYLHPGLMFLVTFLAYFKKLYNITIFIYMLLPSVGASFNMYFISIFPELNNYTGESYMIIFWIFLISGMNFRQSLISAIITWSIIFFSSYFVFSFNSLEFSLNMFYSTTALFLGLVISFALKNASETIFKKQEELEIELNNRDLLLRELFHRVKNNLQIISSLLFLQSKKIEDKKSKEIFKDNIKRIEAIALVHEKVYKENNLEEISFSHFLSNLIESLKSALNMKDTIFTVKADNIFLSLEKATPVGVIVNEIVTNSLKYAFNETIQEKKIDIELRKKENNLLLLKISDNGIGAKQESVAESFGLNLIATLVTHQLEGSIEYSGENGFSYTISFQG